MADDGFIRDLAAFTDALGVKAAPHAIYLAMVPWPDTQSRDTFIKNLTGKDPRRSTDPRTP